MIEIRVGELSRELGVHRNTVRNWINSGRLKAKPAVGKKYVVGKAEFQRFCREQGIPEAICHKFVQRDLNTSISQEENMTARVDPEKEPVLIGPRESVLRSDPQWADVCLTCGSCASACPISGVDGMDPRKIIRLVVLGRSRDVIDSNWPWKCTLCGKCEEACPMNVEIVPLMRKIRSLREREKVPGPLHKGVLMALRRGNNLGIPKEDFVDLLVELGEELSEECCPNFETPIDLKGARVMYTINSKEPFGEPDDLKFWWKIFYAAGESWTVPSENWEGVNWGLFTGDDDALRIMVGRIVDNMYRLECSTLVYPE